MQLSTPRTGPREARGSVTSLSPLGHKARSGPYLGLRRGRQNLYDLGRGFLLHPPLCGGSGVGRTPGKVRAGSWSSRLGRGCRDTRTEPPVWGFAPHRLSPHLPGPPRSARHPTAGRQLLRRLPGPGLAAGCPTSPARPGQEWVRPGQPEGGRGRARACRGPGRATQVLGPAARGRGEVCPTNSCAPRPSRHLSPSGPLPVRPPALGAPLPAPRPLPARPRPRTHPPGGRCSGARCRGTCALCAGRRGAVRPAPRGRLPRKSSRPSRQAEAGGAGGTRGPRGAAREPGRGGEGRRERRPRREAGRAGSGPGPPGRGGLQADVEWPARAPRGHLESRGPMFWRGDSGQSEVRPRSLQPPL